MKLLRPSVPKKCAPDSYSVAKAILLERCRDAIRRRDWQCKDLAAYMPSIRARTFDQFMAGDDWLFSLRFAYSVAEAVGVDPNAKSDDVLLPPWRPKVPKVVPGQLAFDLPLPKRAEAIKRRRPSPETDLALAA